MLKKSVYKFKAVGLLFSMVFLAGCQNFKTNEHLDMAYESINELEYDTALLHIQDALDNGEDERLVLRAKGITCLGMGDYTEAINSFEKSLSLSNGIIEKMDIDINYYLATAYYKSGNLDEAIKIYDTILSIYKNEVDARFLRGILYAQKNELELAKNDFDKAISLAPNDYEMLIKIYQILFENGYKDVGLNYLQDALGSGSKKMSNYEKGQISFYLEDYESAKTYLEKAVEEVGESAALFLGRTYELLGDTNYAVSVYSSYIGTGDASAEIYNQLGLCKMNMMDYEGALTAFQQAMQRENCNITQSLKFNEIVAYEHLGNFDKAKSLMDVYIRNYPDDEAAKKEAQFLKTR